MLKIGQAAPFFSAAYFSSALRSQMEDCPTLPLRRLYAGKYLPRFLRPYFTAKKQNQESNPLIEMEKFNMTAKEASLERYTTYH